jgi:hypothetical protein
MLQASSCSVCGHRFRTRFVEPPIERTEAFTLMAVPPPARPLRRVRRSGGAEAFRLAFLSSFSLIALAGGLICLGWSFRQPPTTAHAAQKPVPTSRTIPVNQAVSLYRAIKPMMSLYDMDKAAGGTGRVIRGSDPHTLLLSYDYPPQSVHVSLFRSDLEDGDYQVQAVSLYQGKILLQRHAEIE